MAVSAWTEPTLSDQELVLIRGNDVRVPIGAKHTHLHLVAVFRTFVAAGQRDCRLRVRRILPGKSNLLLLLSPGIGEGFGKARNREMRGPYCTDFPPRRECSSLFLSVLPIAII
jgi:hypothetical protein